LNPVTGISLTIAALAWNEADHLQACFKSMAPITSHPWVQTLILLDSARDAKTERVAHQVAGRVLVADFMNFSVQRNRALDHTTTDWVFFIDPDERCTPVLAGEILRVIADPQHAAYRVPRRNFIFRREVRHTGWWPDYQIRLLNRARCRYDETNEVHERPIVDGTVGTLQNSLIHFNYLTWGQFVAKQRAYAKLDARALYREGGRAHPRSFVGQPIREFKRRFLDYQGYKDGPLGFTLSVAMSVYTIEKYRQLLLLQRKEP
jgi:glycosyltransferase involved in cell wall biosynthesis